MGARRAGCLGAIVIALIAGVVVAAAIPTLPTDHDQEAATWFARVFAFVLVTFGVGMTLNAILARLAPTPAEIAKREADRAMKEAPLRTTADAAVGQYLRVRGRLELGGGPAIDAPVTGRACVAWLLEREGHGKHNHVRKQRQRGVRARLVDSAGAIVVALDGQDFTMTGDAAADAIMRRAQDSMRAFGEDPRLFPEITFTGRPARVWSDATEVTDWPKGAEPPNAERLGTLGAREFPNARGLRATYREEALLVGQEVEIVGLVISDAGALVLTGPANGRLRVLAR